ncbi:exonuclease SbcCD subunit D C-terminal domain-containing protein [Orbus sasakiae]|uniref:Nuclease SbcCD subunit D n=1 Tax=Orbus sasakiae TaxID=1078475 RepID=A0ABP9N3W0_9GAMM
MKFLHTSDWHLGRSLYNRKRYDEFAAFLDWLVETIIQQEIDVLLIAGDIFDTSTPSNRAQSLYYRFLNKASQTCCRHIVITGGNHDSPSFLNAPKVLLEALNIYVVGAITDNLEDEVITLIDINSNSEAIICAVPYLRDKDVRTVEAGESGADKNLKLIAGIHDHYQKVSIIAQKKQKEIGKDVPIIAMGHLFATGGKTTDNDGVRELYVGSLAQVGEDAFPECFDYVALGHLHIPQRVGKSDRIRYSGSPIAMGYGEANQTKQVINITFQGKVPQIKEITIPCFQSLARISGNFEDILTKIAELKLNNSNAWLEIDYTGTEIAPNLQEALNEAISSSQLEILRVRNRRQVERILRQATEDEQLEQLNEFEVFERCLDANDITETEREELQFIYNEIIRTMQEDDIRAE